MSKTLNNTNVDGSKYTGSVLQIASQADAEAAIAFTQSKFDEYWDLKSTANLTEASSHQFFEAADATKLSGIAVGANVNVPADWDASSGDALILNKPTTISSAQATAITANTAKETDVNHNVTTDLSISRDGGSFSVVSSDGTNAAITLADTNNWGIMSGEMFDKLDGIEAAADVTDSTNVNSAGAVMEVDTSVSTFAFVKDENTMSSNSSTHLATQASIKAFVENQSGIGEVNVNADWTETNTELDTYIDNKQNIQYTSAIPAITATVGGLMANADAVKFASIEDSADVTDTTNVNSAGAVMETDYEAHSLLVATSDDTPVALGVVEQTFVGRKTGGNISDLNATESRAILNVEDGADVTDGTNVTSAGALMKTGGTMTGALNVGDSLKVNFGEGSDLQIYHDNTNSYIEDGGTGDLRIVSDSGVAINSNTSDAMATFYADGAVSLYYDNGKKIATTTTGIDVTGNVVVSGNVDGRDVATDGTKLDGIEASATTDQTDAEIRSAVEAATDSNVFTDTDHTKLNGIATNANNYSLGDNEVTLAKMAGLARGKIIYGDASGDPAALAVGAADQVLTHNGVDISWEDTQTVVAATESVAGIVKLATTGEVTTGSDTVKAVTSAGVQAAVNDLLDGAPDALDTLNELAAAIDDDASYAATVTTALGLKAPKASPTFTGTVTAPNLDLTSIVNADADTDKFLVVDSSNNVHFRTGTEVAGDIGAIQNGSFWTDAIVANSLKAPIFGSPADTQITFWKTYDGDEYITGDSDLTFDGTELLVSGGAYSSVAATLGGTFAAWRDSGASNAFRAAQNLAATSADWQLYTASGSAGSESWAERLRVSNSTGNVTVAEKLGVGKTDLVPLGPIHTSGAGNQVMYYDCYHDNTGSHTGYIARKSNNDTEGVITETPTGSNLFSFTARGVNSSGAFANGGFMVMVQDGAAGTTHVPTAIQFWTATANDGITLRMTIDPLGDVDIDRQLTASGMTYPTNFNAADGKVLTATSAGACEWEDPASSGHTIQDEGSDVSTTRDYLNFVGELVTAADDGSDSTDVTIDAKTSWLYG